MCASSNKQSFKAVTAIRAPLCTRPFDPPQAVAGLPNPFLQTVDIENDFSYLVLLEPSAVDNSERVLVFVSMDTFIEDDEQVMSNHIKVNTTKVYQKHISENSVYDLNYPYFFVKNGDIISGKVPKGCQTQIYFTSPVTIEEFDCGQEFEEQIGEEMDAPQATHPTDTKTPLKINSEDNIPVPKHVDIQFVTDDSATAIDTQVKTGLTSSRIITRAMTPSGEVDVINLSDKDPISLKPADHLMSATLPAWSIVWKELTPDFVTDHDEYSLDFNDRIKLQMLNFQHYSSLAIFKIVAPLPLFSSQRFWVALDTGVAAANEQNKIGFEWCPSEEPEIYVLMPWTSNKLALPIETPIPGGLSISELTPYIYTDGNSTTANINVYCCPYQMHLYTPYVNNLPEPTTAPSALYSFKTPNDAIVETFSLPSESYIIVSNLEIGRASCRERV